jgi:hypothetical protein
MDASARPTARLAAVRNMVFLVAFPALLSILAACGEPSSPGALPTILGTTSPLPTASSPSPGWRTYDRPASKKTDAFSFQYPASWTFEDGGVSEDGEGLTLYLKSWNPATTPAENAYPPESMKVDVGVFPRESGFTCVPKGTPTQPATLSGEAGSQTSKDFQPARADGLTREHFYGLQHGSFVYCIGAYFAQAQPDEATFQQIVDSFTLM